MSILDRRWFTHIIRPSRYLGNEFNSLRKDLARIEVSIALAFPDVYEVGMSHLGLKILYHILNKHNWLAAERVFSPWVDLEEELRSRKILPATLESGRLLTDFDIIGFSLQYELSYTNVLNMLDLAGIPILAAQRTEDDPLIIAGGPACFNPEPIADFFDVIVVGDGEIATAEICRLVREKKQGSIKSKEALFAEFRQIKGIYIPSDFKIHYKATGCIDKIEPLYPDYPSVLKAILPNIDDCSFPEKQIVPFTELIHDRLSLEISRGCTRGCRFCQAGMIYRPLRERNPLSVIKNAETSSKQTGFEDLSLLSLSTGDYSCIEPVLKALMDRLSDNKVAISLPSLRIDSLSPLMIEQIKRVRKTGFTLAVEAGNDRLRKVINKGLTQTEILNIAKTVYDAGWKVIKLYFMVGLPLEQDSDIQDIVQLAQQIANLSGKRGNRNSLNVSVSTFVPKSHTPFMWSPQITLEESWRRIHLIRDGLKGNRIRVKWNQPEMSWLEGIFSRGDRRLSQVVRTAWTLGAKYDAWGEHFRIEIWKKAFSLSGLDPQFYLQRQRSMDEILPWDHIRSGVSSKFLKNEWERAKWQRLTPDCRKSCLKCGVCDHQEVFPIIYSTNDCRDTLEKVPTRSSKTPSPTKYRLTFTKLNHAKFLSHLELVRAFIRAFRRTGLDFIYSKGFHPMPRISFLCALPVGTESLEETVDIQLVKPTEISYLKTRINSQLPEGIHVISIEEIAPGQKKVKLKEVHYQLTIENAEFNEASLNRFLESDHFPIFKVTKKGEHTIDAKSVVQFIRIISNDKIEIILKHTEGPQLKPETIISKVFKLEGLDVLNFRKKKTKQVFE